MIVGRKDFANHVVQAWANSVREKQDSGDWHVGCNDQSSAMIIAG